MFKTFKKKHIVILFFALLVIVFVFFQIKEGSPQIITTQPKDGSVLISQETGVSVLFDEVLKENITEKISFEITPKEPFESNFSEKSMIVSFKESLQSNTLYTIVIKFSNKEVYRFSFQTTPFTKEIISKEGKLQTIDDRIFGEAFEKFIEDYPWYVHLPIERSQYHIVYDFEEESFRIRILIPILDPEQEEILIENAIEDLKTIGLVEPINYYVIKE